MANPIRTVVLACAKQRRADLGAVVEVLAGRGNAVEVVTGVESNPLPWEQAVGRIGPNAIYVVCGDDVLTLEKIAGLRATLQRGNVPLRYIWAGPINWAEPVQVLRHADQLLRTANGQTVAPPSEASGRTVLSPPPPPTSTPTRVAAPPAMAMPMPMPASATQPNPTPPPTMGSANDSLVVEGMGNRKAMIVVGAGMALTALIAIAVLWPSDDAEETVAVADASAKAKAPAATKAKDDAPAKKVISTKSNDAPPDEPEKADTPETPETPEAAPTPEPAAKAEPVAVAADVEAVEVADTPGEAPGPDMPPLIDDPAVAEALRNQSIRLLDILLVSPEARVLKRRHWRLARHRHADAAKHCDNLVVDGVDGWRLPSIGELASLTTANILGKQTTYWSDTKGDTYGNTRVIWAVRTHRMHSVGASNRGARTICVRNAV